MSELPEITCEEVEALLPLVVDGAIDAGDDPQLFAHLARCPDCQESLACYDLAELALAGAAPATREAVVIRHLSWPVAAGGGLLAAAAALLAWMGLSGEATPDPVRIDADARVIAVRTADDGSRIYLIEQRDGQIVEVDAADGSTLSDGLRGDGVPVQSPFSRRSAVIPIPTE